MLSTHNHKKETMTRQVRVEAEVAKEPEQEATILKLKLRHF